MVAAAVVTAAAVWHVLVATIWQLAAGPRQASDFASYYWAAVAVSRGVNPYDPAALAQLAGGPVHPFFYPPPFLLLVAWMPDLDFSSAGRVWFWTQELALIGVAISLYRLFRKALCSDATLLIALCLSGAPVFATLYIGQANLTVLLVTLLGLQSAGRRPILGGALVGWACMMKMSPALFVAWWMLRRRWRAVAGACACASLLSVLVLPLVGLAQQLYFYIDVLPGFVSGDYNGLKVPINNWGNHSIPNLLDQWMPGEAQLAPSAKWLAILTFLGLLVGCAWCFRKACSPFEEAAQIGAVGIVGLVSVVYTYEHHLIWAVPAFLVVGCAIKTQRLGSSWAFFLFPALLIWGCRARLLIELDEALVRAGLFWLGFLVRESKFFVLLLLGGLCLRLGMRPTDRAAQPMDGT